MHCFKKILLSIVICVSTVIYVPLSLYATDTDINYIACINESTVYINDKKIAINPPILIFDKTYIDIYEFARLYGVEVSDEHGNIVLKHKNSTKNLSEIKYWDDLQTSEGIFLKHGDAYYSRLRDFTNFLGLDVLYDNGVLYIGSNPRLVDSDNYFPNRLVDNSNHIAYENYGHSFTITPNCNIAFADGQQRCVSPPVIIFDKIYADIYDMAAVLGIELKIHESQNITATFDRNTITFSPIKYWDDTSIKNRYLKIDNKIYVPLREFSEALKHNVFFDNWVVSIRYSSENDAKNYFNHKNINTDNLNDYVYKTYPYDKTYTVNPYKEYSYENMLSDAKKLKQMYPELIELDSIGQSVEGRELLLIKFGKGDKKIFVCGTHHAREYICTTYLMYATDRYAYSYANTGFWNNFNVKQILDNVTFYIVPMVNPDGVNLVQNGVSSTKNPEYIKSMSINESPKYGYSAWKSNVNGVDINWNYDKDWTYERTKGPRGSTGFNGYAPNSEPETVAMTNIIDSIPFKAFLSFHTQGKLIYYCDDIFNPTGLDKVLKNQTGFDLYYEKRTGIGGSFFDYAARKFGKTTVTFELCPYIGNYPYPNGDFDTVWKPAQNLLLVFGNYYQYVN